MKKNSKKKIIKAKGISEEEVNEIKDTLGDIPISILIGMRLEGLSSREIATKCGMSQSTASRRLRNWSLNRIEYFKKHRATIFCGIGERLIDLIEEKIEAGAAFEGIKDLTGALVKIYDRERVERGLTTQLRTYSELDVREKELLEEEKKLRAELEASGKVKAIK